MTTCSTLIWALIFYKRTQYGIIPKRLGLYFLNELINCDFVFECDFAELIINVIYTLAFWEL